jgi:hypothetical protein
MPALCAQAFVAAVALQGLEARLCNRGVMDEHIRIILLGDDPKPFVGNKPLDGSIWHGGDVYAATHDRKPIKKTASGMDRAVAVP